MFPIPMRGNELGAVEGAVFDLEFPIPMRGNETVYQEDDGTYTGGFQSP